MISTEDFELVGEKVKTRLIVEQSILDQEIGLNVNINFVAEPPSFDRDEFTIPPLSCSDEDLFWSLKLPSVRVADEGKVSITLQSTKIADLFMLQEGNVLVLKGSSLQEFLASKECFESEKIDVDFVLSSELLGVGEESIAIPIERKEQ